MSKCILTVGNKIVDNGSTGDMMVKYSKFLEIYKNDRRPSKEPGIWTLIAGPQLKK